MTFGWAGASRLVRPITAAGFDTGRYYYVGLAVMVVIMIVALIMWYRTWEEIQDVEDPDTPADLLASFEKAHSEGELDDRELERVRRLLADGGAGGLAIPSKARPEGPVRPQVGPSSPEEGRESTGVGGTGPSAT